MKTSNLHFALPACLCYLGNLWSWNSDAHCTQDRKIANDHVESTILN